MSSKVALFFIIFALILVSTFAHEDNEEGGCSHDSVEHEVEFGDLDEGNPLTDQEGRFLASSPRIRLYPYYGYFNGPSSYRAYIQNELVPPVIDFFEAALRVRYPVYGRLTAPKSSSNVCGFKVPSILRTGVSADYFIFFDSAISSGSWVAESTYCLLSTGSRRPFVSKTLFNRKMIVDAKSNVLLHEKNSYLLIHELIHTFGFSKGLYPYFLDEKGRTRTGHIKKVLLNGSTRTVLNVPTLTAKLRKFFGCASLEGAFMEEDGGSGTAGSHFERRHFVYDTMTSGVIHGRRLSEFSLGVLEASGWYNVDYSYADPYFFGKGEGCNFLKLSCTSSSFKFAEFCKATRSRGCAPHGRGGGICQADTKSDGCKYYYPLEDYDCENSQADSYARLPSLQTYGRGAGSKCFSGTLSTSKSLSTSQTSFCFKFTCKGSYVTVNVGRNVVTCKKAGLVAVPGYYGGINCPDPRTFCSTIGKKYCSRGCMGRGYCSNDKCVCYKGYKGTDCGLTV